MTVAKHDISRCHGLFVMPERMSRKRKGLQGFACTEKICDRAFINLATTQFDAGHLRGLLRKQPRFLTSSMPFSSIMSEFKALPCFNDFQGGEKEVNRHRRRP